MEHFAQLSDMFPAPNWDYDLTFVRSLIALVVALLVALLIIRFANRFLPKFAERITDRAAARAQGDELLAVRRTETMLNVVAAVGRALLIILSLYIAWRLVNPTSAPLAIIGASTIVAIIGVATISPLLRDITSGVIMITEHWYEIGDYIALEPFARTSGVVEQVNLRSTKLRSLTGEIIWIHNQHIQGVRVTPRGLRTISIDLFVKDKERGQALIEQVLPMLPTGPAMIATPLTTTDQERLGSIWRITVTGQTTPGREWLIEDFAVKALIKADSAQEQPVMVYDPISRYTDEVAERRFLRSIKGRHSARRVKPDNVTKIEEL